MNLEIFLISFIGSFIGTLLAILSQYWFFKKSEESLEKLKEFLKHHLKHKDGK